MWRIDTNYFGEVVNFTKFTGKLSNGKKVNDKLLFKVSPFPAHPITVTRQELSFNKRKYEPGDILIGHVNVEFSMFVQSADEPYTIRRFFFKGYIRTKVDGALASKAVKSHENKFKLI